MDTYTSSINGSLLQKLGTAIILAVAFFISAGLVVYLSLRGKEVKVPDLIGKAEGDAEKILEPEGLRLKVRSRGTDEKVQANLISEQMPAPGATVKAGQVISVTISTGIEAKKEDAKAETKPSTTPKPKPKPKPSTSPTEGADKSAATDSEASKTSKTVINKGNEPDKTLNKNAGEPGKGKPSPSPMGKGKPSPSPVTKPSAKPSPKKAGTN